MKKRNYFFIYGLLIMIYVSTSGLLLSQTTSSKASIRHYFGQTESYILNNFENCHIEYIKESLNLTCNSGSYQFLFKNKLCNQVSVFYNDTKSASDAFLAEIYILKKEGWKIESQTTDETASIDYVFKRDDQCINFWYVLGLDFLSYTLCD